MTYAIVSKILAGLQTGYKSNKTKASNSVTYATFSSLDVATQYRKDNKMQLYTSIVYQCGSKVVDVTPVKVRKDSNWLTVANPATLAGFAHVGNGIVFEKAQPRKTNNLWLNKQ